ncbi:hypothetical protein CHCC20442_4324 [Bacillus licheniformis]|uniref:hypothetical protein n=1 Tax=Bacillus licheniformis TaxID=1402 RepID=UPI0011A17A70|nr:hypothetical protein [Bacillus licheniformis]TWK08611.1 hypothetical protein CHCC20442_4324 [Bacillus licheniformis]
MRNIFELSRYDLWWLEDKFIRYQQLDKEIAIRKEELKMQEPDENVGGGKSNVPGNPIESQIIKEQSDPYIITRQHWKRAIEQVYNDCTEEEQQVLQEKFWSNQNYLSWPEIGERHHFSKTTIYDMRYSILERFAKEIGYI